MESDESRALGKRFHRQRDDRGAGRLLAVWTDERIAAICSQMNTLTILKANTEAAVNQAA
jgi:hypothetical protein